MLSLGTPPPRQHLRRCNSRRRLQYMSTACLVIFLFVTPATARAKQAPYPGQPDDEPTQIQPKRKLIERVDGSTITLHNQSYSGPAQYRFKTVQHHLGEIFKSAPLLDEVERQNHQLQPELGDVSLREGIFKIYDTLVTTLLSLASVHHDEWANAVGEAQEESEAVVPPASDHFNKAVNAYETALSVYGRLWQVMKRSPGLHASSVFSTYEQQELMLRQAQAHFFLATIFHQRHQNGHPASGDGRTAYEHLTKSQNWVEQSASLLGVDLEDDSDEGTCTEEQGAEHIAAVKNARKSMASIQLQMGSLVSELYKSGYVLNSTGDLRFEPSHDLGEAHLRDDQKTILTLALTHLLMGLSHYVQLSVDGSDYRLRLAECCTYIGITLGNLHEWESAVQQLEMASSLYVDLFEANKIPKADLDLSAKIMKTTESLYEAYLNLHGETGNAKKAFLQHVSFRRYFESQSVPLDHPLSDDDGHEESNHSNDVSEDLNAGNFTSNNEISTSLATFEKMLEDYLRQQNSAYEVWFDIDGNTANYVHHDIVYEGSLRYAIGSLKLAQNQVGMAKNELQLAVQCLRDGVEDGMELVSWMKRNDDNEGTFEYSTKMELANALMSLAYAELGLRNWLSSFGAFEQAMDLFALELAIGESPMKNSLTGAKGA